MSEAKNYEGARLKIVEYENKIAMLSQEIERLTNVLESERRLRITEDEIEGIKRKSIENEKRITEKYEAEIKRRVVEYERKLAERAQESNVEL